MANILATGARRPSDMVGRWGGEEFLLILPETGHDAALARAETLRDAIEKAGFAHPHGKPGGVVTVSAGVATSDLELDRTFDTLLARADQALYAAKREGRNRVKPAGA